VPILGDIPGVGLFFSNRSRVSTNTETVVLITPKIITQDQPSWADSQAKEAQEVEQELSGDPARIDEKMDALMPPPDSDPLSIEGKKPQTAKPQRETGSWITLSPKSAQTQNSASDVIESVGLEPDPAMERSGTDRNPPVDWLNLEDQ